MINSGLVSHFSSCPGCLWLPVGRAVRDCGAISWAGWLAGRRRGGRGPVGPDFWWRLRSDSEIFRAPAKS